MTLYEGRPLCEGRLLWRGLEDEGPTGMRDEVRRKGGLWIAGRPEKSELGKSMISARYVFSPVYRI
jgi:hypothetical protein